MLDGATAGDAATAAARRARLKPLYAETRFWQELGAEPLPRPVRGRREPCGARPRAARGVRGARASATRQRAAARRAALVHARAARRCCSASPRRRDWSRSAWSTPGSRPHRSSPRPSACCTSSWPAPCRGDRARARGAGLRRTRFEILPQHGWLALQQAWLDAIAAAFVRKTRFDPLHQAATEQRLCDGLPDWLDAARADGGAAIEVEAGATTHAVEFSNERFRPGRGSQLDEYAARAATRASGWRAPAPAPVAAIRGAAGPARPGSREMRDCEIDAPAARCGGTRRPGLGKAHPRGRARARARAAPAGRIARRRGCAVGQPAAIPAGARPTHVRPREPRLPASNRRPLTLGAASAGGAAGARARARRPASRARTARFRSRTGWRWLEDHSTYGTLRERRARGRARRAARRRPPARRQPGRRVRARARGRRTMARRKIEIFSLSFLDMICCGFGAIVLLLHDPERAGRRAAAARNDELQCRGEQARGAGARGLQEPRRAAQQRCKDTRRAPCRPRAWPIACSRRPEKLRQQLAEADKDTLSQREAIEQLKADLKSLDEGKRSASRPARRARASPARASRASSATATGST